MAQWAVFAEVAVLSDTIFLRVVRMVFLLRKRLTTIFNYQILCQVLGLRFLAMLTVPITPNISTKLMLRASLSESLVYIYIRTHRQGNLMNLFKYTIMWSHFNTALVNKIIV